MLAIGDMFDGRYRILDEISGGMSAVYKALDTHTNQHRAIKELDAKQHAQVTGIPVQELEMRFGQEMQTLAKLSHPAIPRIHGHIARNNCLYMVMDWIEGQTLEAIIQHPAQNNRRPTEKEAIALGLELLEVLEYLHTRKHPIIFRDLKPANIMRRDSNQQLALIDFGIVKELGADATRVIQMTQALGTEGYAPIEQCQGNPVTKTDIYALGCVLVEYLTGQKPQMLTPPEDVRQTRPEISAEFAALLAQATKPDAKDRPSATDMRADLRQIQRGLPPIKPVIPPAVAQAGRALTQAMVSAVGWIGHQIAAKHQPSPAVKPATPVTNQMPGSAVAPPPPAGAPVSTPTPPTSPAPSPAGKSPYVTPPTPVQPATPAKAVAPVSAPTSPPAVLTMPAPNPPTSAPQPTGPMAALRAGHQPPPKSRWTQPLTRVARWWHNGIHATQECQDFLQNHTWQSPILEQRASRLVQAMESANALRLPRQTLTKYRRDFWLLVFDDYLAENNVSLERESLAATAEPEGLIYLRTNDWLQAQRSWMTRRRATRPHRLHAGQLPAHVMALAATFLNTPHPQINLEKVGVTHFTTGTHDFYKVHVLVNGTWYAIHAD